MTAPAVDTGAVTVVELFAGIGGLSLGLERAGLTVVGQVEIDPWCRQVLARHWPEVPRHDDVRTATDWWRSRPRPRVDVVAGGFPCQPASDAGHKLGPADPRWLWPAMADFINAIRPEWVVWENVPGLRTRGLHLVHADLVRLGYQHRVGTVSACAVGAPHMRRRLFGLAHTHRVDGPPRLGARQSRALLTRNRTAGPGPDHHHWPLAPDTPLRRGADGVPTRLDRTGPDDARRITGLGNAVVPAVGEHVGHLLMAGIHHHHARDGHRDEYGATA